LAATQGEKTLLYCADVLPQSPLLVMDPLPACTLALIDASYGDDPVPAAFRARQINDWINAHPGLCLLPTPLIGRSLELLLAIPTPVSIHTLMVETLAAQLERAVWFQPGTVELLRRRLAEAKHWRGGDAWPNRPLICHDGMGLAGPSEQLIPRARSEDIPILFTGHLPIGSPGEHAVEAGAADFIRLPTHPTRDENIGMVRACNASRVIGHSCTTETLEALAPHLPIPLELAKTGDHLDL
ncbi:MAG: MBL fold metallo-hydrolase, partial [Alphaproteobacteria bacterium]